MYTEEEWKAWHQEQKSSGGYSDDEWRRYRLERASAAKAAPTAPGGDPSGPAAPTAASSMDVRNLLALPDEWRIRILPEAANTTHRKSDFSKLQHDSNRMLRKMFTCWQRDLDRLRDEQGQVLRGAMMNQTTANVSVLQSSQKTTQMEQELEKTKAELSAALEENKKLQQEKADMETDFQNKSKADDLKKQMEHGAKIIMEVKRAKSPIKKELKAVKEDTIAYRAKCRHAFELWRQHSDRKKFELEQVRAELQQTKLELGLFKDLDFKEVSLRLHNPCSRI